MPVIVYSAPLWIAKQFDRCFEIEVEVHAGDFSVEL